MKAPPRRDTPMGVLIKKTYYMAIKSNFCHICVWSWVSPLLLLWENNYTPKCGVIYCQHPRFMVIGSSAIENAPTTTSTLYWIGKHINLFNCVDPQPSLNITLQNFLKGWKNLACLGTWREESLVRVTLPTPQKWKYVCSAYNDNVNERELKLFSC